MPVPGLSYAAERATRKRDARAHISTVTAGIARPSAATRRVHNAIAFLAALLLPSVAVAQLLEVQRSTEPVVWTSLSAGFFQAQTVEDGRTSSIWEFGTGLQYRGSLEYALERGASVGAVVSYARLPLTYFSTSGTITPGCGAGCDAHADLWSIMGVFHIGGGAGFHQVIDLAIGVTRYANFEADDGGTLPPEQDTDLALAVGYGFGYTLGDRLQVMLVQDFAVSLHQGEGLSGGTSRTPQQRTTRLGVRYGLGSRTRR